MRYLYSIETATRTNKTEGNLPSYLPELEKKLHEKLVPDLCIKDDNDRLLRAKSSNLSRRRYVNPRRRLAPKGICSAPDDVYHPEGEFHGPHI